MRIDGAWRLCDDGVVRPLLRGHVRTANGQWRQAPFLVDTGADRTVFSADLLEALGLLPAIGSQQLEGIGGQVASVVIATQIRFTRETGAEILFTGQFAAFIDLTSIDMSVLGRDLTNLFAVIVDRPQEVVCLLGGNHRYVVVEQ